MEFTPSGDRPELFTSPGSRFASVFASRVGDRRTSRRNSADLRHDIVHEGFVFVAHDEHVPRRGNVQTRDQKVHKQAQVLERRTRRSMEIVDGRSPPRGYPEQRHHDKRNNGHLDTANRISRRKSCPRLFHRYTYIVTGK